LQNPDRIFPDRIYFARWVPDGENILLFLTLELEDDKEKVKYEEDQQEL